MIIVLLIYFTINGFMALVLALILRSDLTEEIEDSHSRLLLESIASDKNTYLRVMSTLLLFGVPVLLSSFMSRQ